MIVYACSLARALHLEVLTSLETTEFLGNLKRFIACRGRPRKIYSDNGGTLVAAAEWLRTVMKDQRVRKLLTREQIKWQFNVSRAPWWGGQFERMIGLIKQSLYKTSGKCLFIARRIERGDCRCGSGPQKSSTKLCRGRYTVSYFQIPYKLHPSEKCHPLLPSEKCHPLLPSEKCLFIARRIERGDSRCGSGSQKSSTKLCRGRYTVSYSKFPFIQSVQRLTRARKSSSGTNRPSQASQTSPTLKGDGMA